MTFPAYTYEPRLLSGLLLITAATPLLAALVSQYAFNYPPCELCMYQRYPYVAACVFAIIGLLWPMKARSMVLAGCGAFIVTGLIAIFHVGVEQEWWQYQSACSTTNAGDGSIDSLRSAIVDAPLVSCKQSTFAFLNLSMAAWNVLAGFGLGGLFGYLHIMSKRIMPR